MTARNDVVASIGKLDTWLQGMRTYGGYGGPVTHWWQSCLQFSGPMLDWRYEGIITGYLSLYRATCNRLWLERAIEAADDLRCGQLPNGTFRNSSFEVGPIEGGTPHEAAADIGLLELATVLRGEDDCRWTKYFEVAERNIHQYQIARLWNGTAFLDQAWNTTMVANKNATTMEALLLYEALGGTCQRKYIEGAAGVLLSAQVTAPTALYGGTIHLGSGPHRLAIGIYTARCASALIRLHGSYPEDRYLHAAIDMGVFLLRLVRPNGTIFGYYQDEQEIQSPTWVSPSGDILRALILLKPWLPEAEQRVDELADAIIGSQLPSGGIPTAFGLGRKGSVSLHTGLPDFRDVLPVVGWVDKSFRALAMLVPEAAELTPGPGMHAEFEIPCTWKGKQCWYRECDERIALVQQRSGQALYLWYKGDYYPVTYTL